MDRRIKWIEVGRLEDIPSQGARTLTLEAEEIAVFRTLDDRVFALRDRCPHLGGPLSQGIVHGHAVTCPLHSWVIDLDSGEAQGPDEGCAGTLPVQLEDGRIRVGVLRPGAGGDHG